MPPPFQRASGLTPYAVTVATSIFLLLFAVAPLLRQSHRSSQRTPWFWSCRAFPANPSFLILHHRRRPILATRMDSASMMQMRSEEEEVVGVDAAEGKWSPLDPESLCCAPCLIEQTLCIEPPPQEFKDDNGGSNILLLPPPRIALNRDYANAVLETWRQEEADSGVDSDKSDDDKVWTTEYKRIIYSSSSSTNQQQAARGEEHHPPVPLFGYLVRKASSNARSDPRQQDDDETTVIAAAAAAALPGILLFHTAAGPNDIFLLYKAATLVNTLPLGCIVMIADLMSDGTGWGWRTDKSRFQQASRQLFQRVNGCGRVLLQDRLHAAIDCLINNHHVRVNADRLAVLGWCLGGHAVQELGSRNESSKYSIRGMVTFHGVFDADSVAATSTTSASPNTPRSSSSSCEVLICHGTDDPFASSDMVEAVLNGLQKSRNTVSLLQLRGARHGFTNPAQAYHADQKSFGYDAEAARKSWRQAMALLNRRLSS